MRPMNTNHFELFRLGLAKTFEDMIGESTLIPWQEIHSMIEAIALTSRNGKITRKQGNAIMEDLGWEKIVAPKQTYWRRS